MSRSIRKTPMSGATTTASDQADKRLAQRKLRTATRQALRHGDEIVPTLRNVSDVWSFDKDGKRRYFGKDRKLPAVRRTLAK